jgi:hypothetical protein
MVIQCCLKGIRLRSPGFEDNEAREFLRTGIPSVWLRMNSGLPVASALVGAQSRLGLSALLAHVNSYASAGAATPYISLSAGVILRDRTLGYRVFSAWKSAVDFATGRGKGPGYVYRVWTIVTPMPSPTLMNVSDEIRNLNLFRDAWKWQHQGEITAKIFLPFAQIESVTKVKADGSIDGSPTTNPQFIDPATICNLLKEINA